LKYLSLYILSIFAVSSVASDGYDNRFCI